MNSSSSSTTTPLHTLMYSTFGACLIIFTFLAGHHDCHRSGAYDRGGNAVAKSLNNFSRSGNNNNSKENSNAELFIPHLRGNKKGTKQKQQKPITKEEIWGKPIKRPDDWETWGFYDIHNGFKCREHANDQNKPLPSMEYWNYMRDTFKRVVGPAPAFDDPIPPTEGYTLDDGTKQPYYAKKSPGKGRGLFASRDIKKGEVVHDGTNSDVEISAKDYRRFLFSLPQKMACDSTEWTWTQQLKKDGPFTIRTAFNISVLMNGSKEPNAMPKDRYSSRFLATRDIKKDEEILTDYKIYPTKYNKVGM
eukprot:scaffold237_cov146-Skeletonema_menzelii.AAC.10